MFCAPILGTLPMSPTDCTRKTLLLVCKVAASPHLSGNFRSPTEDNLDLHCTPPPIHRSCSTFPLRLEQQHSQGPMPAGCTRRCTGSKVRTQAHALEIESSYSVSWYSLLNLVELSCLSGKAPHRPCWLPTVFPPLIPAQSLRPMQAAPKKQAPFIWINH